MNRILLLSLVASLGAAHADPLVTSWFTSISTKYARIYTSAANRTAGTSVTTWTNGTQTQTNPAYAGVNEVNGSSNWIYIRTTGLGGHVMGPWNNPNYPKNQGIIWRFPRGAAGAPTVTGQSTLTGLGAIGYFVDGVANYNTSDGFSYSNANGMDASPTAGIGSGDGIWNRDAFTNEAVSFDFSLAHNQAAGEYHYHVNPIATRYLVGDNVNYDSATKNYSENTANTTLQHSPIVGWMKDGLPLYGPYGYDGGSTGAAATATVGGGGVTAVSVTAGGTLYQSVPLVTFSGGGGSGAAATAVVTGGVVTGVTVTNGGSGYTSAPTVKIGGVRRMISGYQYRDGTNNTTNLNTTGRTTLPAWAALAQNRSAALTSGQSGPNVDATYALGHFTEDYDYLGDLGFTQSSRTNSGGVFFDLNKYNVRFCVTPEYPNGTWAYFTTIKADGTSFYPYSVGRWYYGNPSGGSTDATTMSGDGATTQVLAGANSAVKVNTPIVAGGTVTLTWSSVEGGIYSVDASTNQSAWTSEKTNLAPTNVPTAPTTGNSTVTTTTSYATLGSSGTEYARVNRTALATYDATGQTASTVAQSTIKAYSASGTNAPPSISAISAQATSQNTATSSISFTIGDAQTAAASLVVTGSSDNATLVPNANFVFGGSDSSRNVTITPATNQTGSATITITVSDGLDTTSTTFTLTVTASAPSISSIAINPASPTSANSVSVTANVTPPSGRTIAPPVQLAYTVGSGTTSTVFTETMVSSAVSPWTGTGANNAWTLTFMVGPNPYSQTTAANHGAGNACGLECNRATPSLTDCYVTTSNAINATGTSGYVEFYVATANLSGTMGWDFQTSTDGSSWTTRLSETNSNHAHPASPYHYDLAAGERVSTLKLRFRFAGSGMGTPISKISLDDIKLVTTTASAPVTVSMLDDGAHGDGAAGDGVYGASIPAQPLGATVSYTITATDNTTATTISNSASYTVGTGAAALSVTPGTGLTSSGPAGGAFSPSSATWTLTNSGTASMNWTAGKMAAWLTLDTNGGTLAAGANTTVTASVNTAANSLAAGSYSDTIVFTNTTNGSGNTTRAAGLTVLAASALESWQLTWYGSTANTGNSAYTADPYHTGVANLLVFAFIGPNQNPATATVSQLPQLQSGGGSYYFSFAQPAGVSGIIYGAEWSTTLASASWTAITDTGSGSEHLFSVPPGTNTRMFFRLTATTP